MFKHKQDARSWGRQKHRLRDECLMSEKSRRVREFCAQLIAQFEPKRCFLFAPTAYEVDLLGLVTESFPDLECALPVVLNRTSRQMYFALWDKASPLIRGEYSIRVPVAPHTKLFADDGDLIFVPSLVLDSFGGRIGHGMGFYDKWLVEQSKRVRKVGVGFADCLVLDPLPLEDHDQHMDIVVTESAIYWA